MILNCGDVVTRFREVAGVLIHNYGVCASVDAFNEYLMLFRNEIQFCIRPMRLYPMKLNYSAGYEKPLALVFNSSMICIYIFIFFYD